MREFIKLLISKFFTLYSLRGIAHGNRCRVNFYSQFTSATQIGSNCHFNGIRISGEGNVVIGNNFHSGKNIRILTTFHNYDGGEALPYDNTSYSREVRIGDNVWIGEAVIILGGVTIGEGVVIQAGSVVCKDIPALAIAGGHPAIPFKYRDKEHYKSLKEAECFF